MNKPRKNTLEGLIPCVCFLLLSLFNTLLATAANEKRPLTPDDLLRLESLDKRVSVPPVVISPDGQSVAYVLKRPKITATNFITWLSDCDHADIWIVSSEGGHPQNITNGATDDSGFWAPKWSPDGHRLAMLSTRGGNVRVWVWSKSSGKLQMLSERGTNIWWSAEGLQWVSDHELAFSVLPAGKKSVGLEEDHRNAEITKREWAKAWGGREVTASALESGIPPSMEQRPQAQILVVDIETLKEQIIAIAPDFATLRISPNREFLAFLRQVGVWHPDTNQAPLRHIRPEICSLR